MEEELLLIVMLFHAYYRLHCQGRQTTEHVLSSCKVALSQGRYTWRHNRVLQELASVISTAKGEIHPSSTSSTVFITEGGVKKWHGGSVPINTHRKGLLDGCDDWVVSADLPEWERHPDVIRKTALRPDIVIHSASTQQIIMVELTVPYESRMEEAHAFKEAKYLELTKELKMDGNEAKDDGRPKVASRSPHDRLIVASWSPYGHLMVAPWSSLERGR
ncbi:polyprotein [Plakobranchus ocellatus]|uniref:Polyprotein n=1 Tax=Plakobranchus ocellatus TaxID=259542 RepID=A0AAV3YBG2_9GAST|nr:polyprotein [Plakobranchus ocellatus]